MSAADIYKKQTSCRRLAASTSGTGFGVVGEATTARVSREMAPERPAPLAVACWLDTVTTQACLGSSRLALARPAASTPRDQEGHSAPRVGSRPALRPSHGSGVAAFHRRHPCPGGDRSVRRLRSSSLARAAKAARSASSVEQFFRARNALRAFCTSGRTRRVTRP